MRLRMTAFWMGCCLILGGTAAPADVGVSARKLVVVDKGAIGARVVFATRDTAIDKGTGTDPAAIGATLDVRYDNGVDPATTGQFVAPPGSPYWRANEPTVAKYVDEDAPAAGSIRTLVVTSGTRAKVVAKSLGDVPLDLRSQAGAGAGVATTALCIENDGVSECFRTTFSSCTWESLAEGTGARLECRDGTADHACPPPPPPPSGTLRFRTGEASGTCGSVRSGGAGGTLRKILTCGGLSLGGGRSTVPESPVPAGAETQFNVACDGPSCAVAARTGEETGSNGNCSDTGCQFGPYFPISNSGYSWCLQNTLVAPASGTLDAASGAFDGSLPLSSVAYLTANANEPCPKCLGGRPGCPNSGTCNPAWISGVGPSPDTGEPCTPLNASGDTFDCAPPPASVVGTLALDLTSVTTGTASLSSANGLFCPAQPTSGAFGCAGSGTPQPICPGGNLAPLIDHISQTGSPAGLLLPGPHAATLVSTFCVPPMGEELGFVVNSAFNLPGPAAISLPGTLELVP